MPPSNSAASGIIVENGKVYVSGWSYEKGISRACYWVNGTRHELSGFPSRASGIAGKDSKVYITGSYVESGMSKARYWTDGERRELHGENTEATTQSP